MVLNGILSVCAHLTITMIASEDFPSYSSIGDLSEKANTFVRDSVIQTRIEAMNDMIQASAKDYVLFLVTYEDTPTSLLNSVQSLYVIKPATKSTQPGEMQSKSEMIVSANPENDLTLSIDELQEIQSEDQNK
ncbi:hypothetical protein [Paenibacillus pabuli]|uniref:hypothetical protein n=1 Tax=Paenibacillus pabuli TaxID=1472 RepID=UPI003CF81ADF